MKRTSSLLVFFFLVASLFSLVRSRGVDHINNMIVSGKLSRLLGGKPPISISIKDAVYEEPSLDNFNPTVFTPLAEMPRNLEGSFLLLPGVYEFEAESYCLNADAYSPRKDGPGYIYAPIKGAGSKIIHNILQKCRNHPEIAQSDIQTLIWAILTKTKISKMSTEMRKLAATLLTPKELFKLNGGALGLIPERIFQRAIERLPESVQRVLEAQRRLRELFTRAAATYEEIEEIAIRRGIEPSETLVRDIPSGRWSKHPDGFYIRFFPYDYTHTRIELFVPESNNTDISHIMLNKSVHILKIKFEKSRRIKLKTFDPSKASAVSGNTSLQPINASGRKSSDADSPLQKARNATTGISLLGAIGGGETIIPGILAGEILNFNFDTWGKAIDALAGDPPRSDYDRYAIPIVTKIDPVQPGEGLSKTRAAAINDLISTSMRLTSLMHACILTQDRLGGALKANDTFWVLEQVNVLCCYKREAGFTMIRVADQFNQLIEIYQMEGGEDIDITSQMILDYQAKLRKVGFSSEALEAARILGLSKEEIEKIKNEQLAAVPEEIKGGYFDMAENLVNSLKKGGTSWTLLPKVEPYWEKKHELIL